MKRKMLLATCLLGLVGLVVSTDAASARWNRGQCADAVQQRLGNPYMPRGEIRAAIQRCVESGPGAVFGQPSYGQYYGEDEQYGPGIIYSPR